MTGEQLIEKVLKTVQDPSIDEDSVLALLIEGHRTATREINLPALMTSDTVTTVLEESYVALPDDYSHGLYKCLEQDEYNPVRVVNSLGTIITKYGGLENEGIVRHVADATGGILAYQPIPIEQRDLTLFYYRIPTALTESSEPEAIPFHLHTMLASYASYQLFSDIEDGVEGAKVNTAHHHGVFMALKTTLDLLTQAGRAKPAPPVVKGEFL